jgi:hypothetical protein
VTVQKSSKIYVAGHRGMVGSAIVRRVQSAGYTNLLTRTRQALDLLDQRATFDFLQAMNSSPKWCAKTSNPPNATNSSSTMVTKPWIITNKRRAASARFFMKRRPTATDF